MNGCPTCGCDLYEEVGPCTGRKFEADVKRLEAENERLRAALTHIKNSDPFPGNNCTTGFHDVCGGCLEKWAEEALTTIEARDREGTT